MLAVKWTKFHLDGAYTALELAFRSTACTEIRLRIAPSFSTALLTVVTATSEFPR